uniref:hypothetical protein n=1 Tax=Herbidospora sakaeratensis TaxID=564415 RepID=UPI0007852B08|nr:hypothetical protein [Herbidospora sakaeratensis]
MRDLDTLFDRPPATEADLASARARFVSAAATARPHGRDWLKPILAALATALVGMAVAVFLRPVPAGSPPPAPDPLLTERPMPGPPAPASRGPAGKPPGAPTPREILLRAADLAEADPPLEIRPGQFVYTRFAMLDLSAGERAPDTTEMWIPADGKGPWLARETTRHRERLDSVLCPHDYAPSWPDDLGFTYPKWKKTYAGKFSTVVQKLRMAAPYPQVTARILRIVAEFPGMVVKRGVTDAAGRPGLSVLIDTDGDNTSEELVIDQVTDRFMGVRSVYPYESVQDPVDPARVVYKGDLRGGWAIMSVGVAAGLPAPRTGMERAANEASCPTG